MNAIKPTYLWHLTGKKHFNRLIHNRNTCLKHSLQQRERKDFLQFTGYVLVSAIGTFFAFGGLGPKNICPVEREKKSKKCTSTGIPPKCPPENVSIPVQPCPKCGGEKKKKCDPDE